MRTAIIVFGLLAASAPAAAARVDVAPALNQTFHLGAARTAEPRHYEVKTQVVSFAPDGRAKERATYRLLLASTPAAPGEAIDARYRCRSFTVTTDDGPALRLASLDGWSYPFALHPGAADSLRPPLGIPHEPFVDLADADGQPLPASVRYAVYNTFIDFHSLTDLLARPTSEGGGIQNLDQIGRRVVHEAAFSEPRIDLGDAIGKGSKFVNGELTLEFLGLGTVDDVPCALIAFDSGEASFHMTMRPVPAMELLVKGRSHFHGMLFVELESGWVREARLNEMVVAEVSAGGKTLDASPSERTLTIRTLTPEQFAKD